MSNVAQDVFFGSIGGLEIAALLLGVGARFPIYSPEWFTAAIAYTVVAVPSTIFLLASLEVRREEMDP